jgi:hypothetical protein
MLEGQSCYTGIQFICIDPIILAFRRYSSVLGLRIVFSVQKNLLQKVWGEGVCNSLDEMKYMCVFSSCYVGTWN